MRKKLRGLTSSNSTIVSLEPNSLTDMWADMRRVGAALGAVDGADQLVQRLQRRREEIAQNASSLPTRLRMACIEWIDPLMATGNWMPELIEMAGGTNLFGDAGKHSPG